MTTSSCQVLSEVESSENNNILKNKYPDIVKCKVNREKVDQFNYTHVFMFLVFCAAKMGSPLQLPTKIIKERLLIGAEEKSFRLFCFLTQT